jgi:chorismate lyase/3-hydroxybenzoate synthase
MEQAAPTLQLWAPLVIPGKAAKDQSQHEIFRFLFKEDAPENESRAAIATGLSPIGYESAAEIWTSTSSVNQGTTGIVHYSHCDVYCFSWVDLPAEADTQIDSQTSLIYDKLMHTTKELDYPHLIRAWNYFPDINQGEGDNERYRKFSEGRARTLAQHGYAPNQYPAGTAIGTKKGDHIKVVLLTAKQPARMIENPRQTSAYNYPREYGPIGPSFARASRYKGRHTDQLFVSGTASIVGSKSKHSEAFWEQVKETLVNVKALAQDGSLCTNDNSTPLIRIYLRNMADINRLREEVQLALGKQTRILFLHGDICRAELAIEIEGVFWLRQ